MGYKIDLTGNKYDRLQVIEYANDDKAGRSMWKCVCECGKEKIVNGYHLTKGNTKSCGCLASELTSKRKFGDIKGQKFGRMTVKEFSGRDKFSQSLWLCKCDCGNQKVVKGAHLKNGNTKSCGCLFKETVGSRELDYPSKWLETNVIYMLINKHHKTFKLGITKRSILDRYTPSLLELINDIEVFKKDDIYELEQMIHDSLSKCEYKRHTSSEEVFSYNTEDQLEKIISRVEDINIENARGNLRILQTIAEEISNG